MPHSAVLTAVLAVLLGQDTLSPSLLLGAVLGIAAALLSSISDIKEKKKQP